MSLCSNLMQRHLHSFLQNGILGIQFRSLQESRNLNSTLSINRIRNNSTDISIRNNNIPHNNITIIPWNRRESRNLSHSIIHIIRRTITIIIIHTALTRARRQLRLRGRCLRLTHLRLTPTASGKILITNYLVTWVLVM